MRIAGRSRMLQTLIMLTLIMPTLVLSPSALLGQQLLGQQLPAAIDVPAGAQVLLAAKATGAQVYNCSDGRWVLKAPEADLLDGSGHKIGKHSAGPTWQLSDGSQVRGKAIASRPSPDKASIPWLLVEAVPGSASGRLARVAYIRRTDTQGGAAPQEGCTEGTKSVPYSAMYTFYSAGR